MKANTNKESLDRLKDLQEKFSLLKSAEQECYVAGMFKDLSSFGRPEIEVGNTIDGSVIGGYYDKFEKIRIVNIHLKPSGIIKKYKQVFFDIVYVPFKKDGTEYKNFLNGIICLRELDLEGIE